MDQNPEKNPFSRLKIRTLVFILLAILPFLILVNTVFKQVIGFSDALVETLSTTVWFYGVTMLWIWYQFRKNGIKWKNVIGDFPSNFKWGENLGLLLCLLLFNFGSIFLSIGLLSYILPDFVLNFLNDRPNTNSIFPGVFLVVDTLTAIAVAPFVEELLMRGVFLHRFQLKWGIHKALIIAALIFAIGHANILGMFMVALVLSLLYLKYKTLLVPIFFHAMNNTMVSLLQFSSGPRDSKPATIQDAQSTLWLGLIFVVISLPILVIFLRKNWPTRDLVMPYTANFHK